MTEWVKVQDPNNPENVTLIEKQYMLNDLDNRPQWEEAGIEMLYHTLEALRAASHCCTEAQTRLLCWHCGIDYEMEVSE